MVYVLGAFSSVTPTPDYIELLSHGDSRVVGVQDLVRSEDSAYTDVMQFVTGGTGLTATLAPLQQAIAGDGHSYLSPLTGIAQYIVDNSTVKIDLSGGGYNGASLTATSHTLGPLPDTVTAQNIAKGADMYAARVSANPEAVVAPFILTIDCTNDMLGSASASAILAAKAQQLLDLRTATGYSDAPILVIGTLPETQTAYSPNSYLIEAAQKIAALSTPGVFYFQPSSGFTTDNVHESNQAESHDLAYNHYGPSAMIALGLASPRTPNFSLSDPLAVVSGSSTTTNLTSACDQPIYYTGVVVGGSFAELSGDLDSRYQFLQPVGGAWPTFDSGTPANNSRAVSLSYITGDRVTGTLDFVLEIQEPSGIFNTIFDLHVDSPTAGVSEVLPCIAGKSYLIASWDGGGVTVVGEDELVTEISGGLADPLRIFEYLPTSSGDKEFAPSPTTTILYVEEVTGKTFNGSRTGISMGDRSGSFTAPDEVTGAVFAIACGSDAAPTINMTPVGITGVYFNGYTSSGSVTPAGSWSGYTGLIAVGVS